MGAVVVPIKEITLGPPVPDEAKVPEQPVALPTTLNVIVLKPLNPDEGSVTVPDCCPVQLGA